MKTSRRRSEDDPRDGPPRDFFDALSGYHFLIAYLVTVVSVVATLTVWSP